MKWIFTIWIFLGWSLYPVTTDLWAAQVKGIEKELSKKKEELNGIKKRLRLKTKEKEAILRKESSIQEDLARRQEDLHKREQVLKKKRADFDQIGRRIRNTENHIVILARDAEQREGKLGSVLQALYKMSQGASEVNLLSGSSSVDFLRMDKYLYVVAEHYARSTKTCQHELALKRSDERKLVESRLEVHQLISDEERKREKIRRLRSAQEAKLKSTLNQKAICQKSIAEIEKGERLIQSLIKKLEQESRVVSYKDSKYVILKENLNFPVQGKIVGLFKERGQNGIEIDAPTGAPVRALLPGKVLYADWFKGFENLVIIDHGDGIFTISGNCSALLKKRGDSVSEGEVIARVGNSQSNRVPPFYFEIRHRGKPQDPLKWILGSKKKRP